MLQLLNLYYLLAVIYWSFVLHACYGEKPKTSIAIIGGGIGGTSCSHFLWELLGDNILVDLYEEKHLGGRMATINVNGKEYESGGSIIHPANHYMKNFSDFLGLKKRESDSGRLAIFDGKEMVFDGSRFHLAMVIQLIYHYGWDMYRINQYVTNLMSKFERIYQHQSNGHAFTTVESLLRSMDPSFVEMLHRSIVEDMTNLGFGERFLNELVQGGMRTNYGQGLSMHAFVGGVSMAGIEPGLWSVHGGNKLIPVGLLNKSSSALLRAKVTEVVLLSEKKYRVASVDSVGVVHMEEYDFVIIATPLFNNIGNIKFTGFPEPIIPTNFNFHRTLATFVDGIPNIRHFHVANVNNFPEALFTSNPDVFFNSIGRHSPVDRMSGNRTSKEKHCVYKVFSNSPLTNVQLDQLFDERDHVKVADWLAYPEYPSNIDNLPAFKLHNQMFYINAIEMAASAMEMSAIGAKNVALLVFNKIRGRVEYTDNSDIVESALGSKKEL